MTMIRVLAIFAFSILIPISSCRADGNEMTSDPLYRDILKRYSKAHIEEFCYSTWSGCKANISSEMSKIQFDLAEIGEVSQESSTMYFVVYPLADASKAAYTLFFRKIGGSLKVCMSAIENNSAKNVVEDIRKDLIDVDCGAL